MYIQSIIIDGFKSYGRRTEIINFDPEFTAITGLNGTGKSNILDSICFVLGLNNLTQVRATSMQDLVYKSGQAGVTKATVTVIFNNEDQNQCPMGYEKCREISVTRQIAVGGKNRYLINGKQVQNKKAADFFCSIHLNVNNPNFLIMQGRITKVLNMKPQEIMSMIEEAAGTSLYESKREFSTKLIEKKDAKVREIAALLLEEIEPKLEKLRIERQQYSDYQNVCRDIEFLTGIHISYLYLEKKKKMKSLEINIDKISARISDCLQKIQENEENCKKIDQSIKELEVTIDSESGGTLKDVEQMLDKHIHEEARHVGNLKALEANLLSEEKKLKSLEKTILEDEKALQMKELQMSKVHNLFTTLQESYERDSLLYKDCQRKFEAISQGLSTNEVGLVRGSLQDQLISLKQQISEAQTVIKTSEMELRHCRTRLEFKEAQTQNNDNAYIKDKKLQEKLKVEIDQLEQGLHKLDYAEGSIERLQKQKNALNMEIRHLSQQLDCLNAYRYELNYCDPEPNFDRTKVHGMVGKLFKVKDEKNYLGLSMASGGSLFSYVTDDDITSKKILQNGKLQHRVTIIPINKITGYEIQNTKIEIAESLVGKENVQPALNLIDFDPYFSSVMKYVFGITFICRDLNAAQQVTYHKNILCRSVTLEGDIVDPEGTLSGGSRPKGGNILQELVEINRLECDIKIRMEHLKKIEQQSTFMKNNSLEYEKIKDILELRRHELEACKQRLTQTSFQQHQDEIRVLKENMAVLEKNSITASHSQKVAHAEIAEIEKKLADSGYRDRELKAASEAMQKANTQAETSHIKWKQHEQDFETLRLEIEEIRKGISNAEEQKQIFCESLKKLIFDLEEMRKIGTVVSEKVLELKMAVKGQKDKINSKNKELRTLSGKKDYFLKENRDFELEIKKNKNEESRMGKEIKDLLKHIENMEQNYPWIVENRQYFGIKNTRYDYTKEDPIKAGQKLNSQLERKEKMERNINTRAMMLFERQEEEYRETIRRKEIVEQDKEKIQNIIVRMDFKKQEEVERAWVVVDKNFGSIFSSLLPGAQAALMPVSNSDCLIGLEIKVGFNGVWKESLGELSGGQRSLVALSLVLAMLKFSPAPLYILDEVDAALDMSHTQNIGHMLKTHFTNSQFIIVSLKDGMFNNANVLFRTKFEEGVSVVTRTVNARTSSRNRK